MITALCRLLTPAFALASFLCLMVVVLPTYAGSLLMLGKKKVYLSPEIHGTLLNHGKPVPAIEITRLLAYEEDYIDTAITDSNSKFYFPEKVIESSRPNNPFNEVRIFQLLTIKNTDSEIYLWGHQRGKISSISIIDERLASVVFDLSFTETAYHFIEPGTGKTYGITGPPHLEGYQEKLKLD